MMQKLRSPLASATLTAFFLHLGGFSNFGVMAAPSGAATKPSKAKNGFAITQVSSGSNVNRTPFTPGSITSNYAPFNRNSQIQLMQVTGQNRLTGSLVRGVRISENSRKGNFEDNVGKSLPVGSGGAAQGVPSVLVEYVQDNGPANRSRWRAVSGTVEIVAYRRNSPLTEIVTFRLVNARFEPFFAASGSFSLSLQATTSGQRNSL